MSVYLSERHHGGRHFYHGTPLHVQQPCGALVLPLVALIGIVIEISHCLMSSVT